MAKKILVALSFLLISGATFAADWSTTPLDLSDIFDVAWVVGAIVGIAGAVGAIYAIRKGARVVLSMISR